jgi:hypothetical protein
VTPKDEILMHVDALIKLAGLNNSESATAIFIDLLDEAVVQAGRELTRSYEQGLGLDCRWIIVEKILESKVREQKIAAKD